MKNLLFILFTFFAVRGFCQNTIGVPPIVNYSKETYAGGTQNWDVKQDQSGIMYFANNDGLLTFDGTYWRLFPLPNQTNVRSVEIGPDNKIYVGGQDEIGYFSPDNRGVLLFTSLKNLISEKDTSFADVWDVISYGNSIFFHSTTRIFQLTAGKINAYSNPHWRFMGLSNNFLIAQTDNNEVLRFTDGVWKPFLKKSGLPKTFMITTILPFSENSSLITTLKDGLYLLSNNEIAKFESPDIKEISSKRIYCAIGLKNGDIALGTSLNGCYIIDVHGHLIQSFSNKEGLQNNNLLSIGLDRDQNLWLGLDNGIDFISLSNSIKPIYPGNELSGSGYSAMIYHEFLYMGTSNGLFRIHVKQVQDLSFMKGSFEPVINTKGQVWKLCEVNGRLLMGHHDGAFEINGNKASLLDNSTGFWLFLPLDNVIPSATMVAGTYKGINFFEFKNGNFIKKDKNVPLLSARFVTLDKNDIWVSHPYKGIYKIALNDGEPSAIKLYNNRNGLVSENNNYIYNLKNHIVVATDKGVYEYNKKTDSFEQSEYFKPIFGNMSIRYLKEDPSGNIWFISEKKLGVVEFTNGKNQVTYFPELTNKMVNGFEHIYPIDSFNILLGAGKGFYHINYSEYKKNNTRIEVFIRTVKAVYKTDSLLFGGFAETLNAKPVVPTVEHRWNSFHFEYSSTLFAQMGNIEYSYSLDGFNKNWSEWSKKAEKEYTNLPAGSYTFRVKARNSFGSESLEDNYSFIVLPPWYQTRVAYFLYFLLFITGCYILYRELKKKFNRQQIKHVEEQKKLQYLHQLEIDKAEKELIKLRNERLEAEINHKNTELASSAMHLVQKSEMLSKIKEEFTKLQKSPENNLPEDLNRISKLFNKEEKKDRDWQQFETHFDNVHSDFLQELKQHHPDITANELKLSAYLKMNLSTKEIAQLMNISVRGVEIGRYRLRKKLQIPTHSSLFDYLSNFNNKKS